MSGPRVYHYTIPRNLLSILANGLQQATAGVQPPERPAVWFTTRETYEPTAFKGTLTKQGEAKVARAQRQRRAPASVRGRVRVLLGEGDTRTLTFREQIRDFGLARVEVDPEAAPLTWDDWKRTCRLAADRADVLARVSAEAGSDVNEWRMSFEPIPPSRIVRMEVWYDGDWRPVVKRGPEGKFLVYDAPWSPLPSLVEALEGH